MSDQWDPKYPKNRPMWIEDYEKASAEIYRPDSPWYPAFAAVAAAEAAGEFDDLKEIYEGTCDPWFQLHIVWTLVCRPIFRQDQAKWPDYAKAVYTAVPSSWLELGSGTLSGIPEEWQGESDDDRRRVWAFKSTALFIAGLLDGWLPPEAELPAQEEGFQKHNRRPVARSMEGIERLVEERVARAFARKLRPLFQKLDKLERGPLSGQP